MGIISYTADFDICMRDSRSQVMCSFLALLGVYVIEVNIERAMNILTVL
jgi:hypothetical protein